MIRYDVIRPGDGVRFSTVYRHPKKNGPRYNVVSWRPTNRQQRRAAIWWQHYRCEGGKIVGMAYADTSFACFETDPIAGLFHDLPQEPNSSYTLRQEAP